MRVPTKFTRLGAEDAIDLAERCMPGASSPREAQYKLDAAREEFGQFRYALAHRFALESVALSAGPRSEEYLQATQVWL